MIGYRADSETRSQSPEIENQKSKIENSFADRHAKAFCVPAEEIRGNKYDLSINRYKEIAYEEVKYDPPHKILDQLEVLESEITADLKTLRGMLR